MADQVKTLVWNDFSAGWVPDDDAINGRKNGLLQMDNVDLDINGAIRLQQGIDLLYTLVSGRAPVATFSVKRSNGVLHIYFADDGGAIIRDNLFITFGGDPAITAFCTALNYTLICSGFQRWKDLGDGSALVLLGITITPSPSSVIRKGVWRTTPLRADSGISDYVSVVGGWTIIAGGSLAIEAAFPAPGSTLNGSVVVQSYQQHPPVGVAFPFDWSRLYPTYGPLYQYPTPGPVFGGATDNDFIDFQVSFNPVIIYSSLYFTSLQIDFLLVAPGASGDVVSDYYTTTWTNPNASQLIDAYSVFNIRLFRGDFIRVGQNSSLSWSTVYGYRITASEAIDAGTVGFTNIRIITVNGLQFSGGSNALAGNVEYSTQAVNSTGGYLGKAELGPTTGTITLGTDPYVFTSVRILRPTDPQVTNVWLFRRGNNLGQWYRVANIPLSAFGVTSIDWEDYVSDTDAQTIDIIYNINLKSITAGTITEKIYDILGPVEGRWYYFTEGFMYPSDFLNPDLVDVSLSIRTIAATNEVYMWARKVSDSIILVGTTRDIYILKGTFATLPDGTIDIYYIPLSVSFPPVNRNATVFSNVVYYLASDGWRSIDPGGSNSNIIGAATDLLYLNQPRYKYAPAFMIGWTDFQVRPIAVFQNKLVVGTEPTTGPFRFELFDITRKYWRTANWATSDPDGTTCTTLSTLPDGRLILGFSNGKIRVYPSASKFIDGALAYPAIDILSPVMDDGSPRNRKDSLTGKARIYTGGDPVTLTITDSDGGTHVYTITNNRPVGEIFFDLGTFISKTYQFRLTGSPNDLLIRDISIDYELRPSPLTELILRNDNLGTSSKKRIRSRPYVIDTMGFDVTYLGYVDGVLAVTQILNTTDKQTVDVYFITDVFGVDYGAKLLAAAGREFEFYGEGTDPLIVEVAPASRKFDQVGPMELFKYGRCKEFKVRILSLGGPEGTTSALTYNVFMDDDSLITGIIELRNQHDTTYTITLPKGVNGTVMRIEFGPVNFVFCRYYIMAKLLKTGSDTENIWVPLGGNNV